MYPHLATLSRHPLVGPLFYELQQLRLRVSVQTVELGQLVLCQRSPPAFLAVRPFHTRVRVHGDFWKSVLFS